MNIQAIIFDFDGVILDSLPIKSDAFAEIYHPFGDEIAQKALAYHYEHGGVSRYEKFKYLHRTYLNQDLSETEIEALAQQYSALVKEKVIQCPMISGVDSFLESYYQEIDFFVSSGTPQAELREVAKIRNLAPFFKAIYGSPDKKIVHIERILEANSYDRSQVIFIGDATTDRDAAKACQIPFIAREDGSQLLADEKLKIENFKEFDKFLKTNF